MSRQSSAKQNAAGFAAAAAMTIRALARIRRDGYILV